MRPAGLAIWNRCFIGNSAIRISAPEAFWTAE
jgi:hypothetical protein